MREIIGNTTATPNPQSDWEQTNEIKPDYIKNKPTLGALASKDTVEKNDLSQEVQDTLNNIGGLVCVRNIWVGVEDPSEFTGGNDGDIYIQYEK